MSGAFIKDDLRRIKTQKSLLNAFTFLLEKRNFKNITINDLCGEAYISRSAFYANYRDKYDLLNALLETIISDHPVNVENMLDAVVYNNYKMIKNILEDADSETIEIVNNFALNYLKLLLKDYNLKTDSAEYTVFANICTGGVIHHIMRQVKNKCPLSTKETKQYFISLINYLLEWNNV